MNKAHDMNKSITLAENSGFCFGVKRAIQKTEEAIAAREKTIFGSMEENPDAGKADAVLPSEFSSPGSIYTWGQLIHNRVVTDELEKRGVTSIDTLDAAGEGDTVIIRSHGVGARFYEDAGARDLNIIDATCPYVARIHDLAKEAHEHGRQVLIIGDREHPEVQGINGWCGDSAYIAKNEEEAADAAAGIAGTAGDQDSSGKAVSILAVCQTTITEAMMKTVLEEFTRVLDEKLQPGCYDLQMINTICSATSKRQEGCRKLAEESDMMVVIGGKNSSNTKKLYDIAKNICKKTFFIENVEDLPLNIVSKCNRIGVAAGASTPECTIEEVISRMSENNVNTNEVSMEDLMESIDKSLRLPRNGEIVTGKVIQVTDNEVIVNLGCKKDGIIQKNEVALEEGQTLADLFKEDDEVQAKVIKTDDDGGGILLSKKKLEINEHWQEINDAYENKETLNVRVIRTVNGGVIAAYKQVTGFVPVSQLSDKYVEDPAEFLNQDIDVRVTRVDQRRNKVVFSRRVLLTEEREKRLKEIWASLNVDDIVEGTVMRFTDYGAFVDIGGIDGLLHISEISWGKLKHPQEVLKIGEKIHVKILSMNEEKGKISLGLKQTTPEPWTVIDEKYNIDDVVDGKVVQIKEYGAFVELEPGLDGLVHISEIAHKRVADINDELSIGETVKAKILDIDKDKKRISLSIKATKDPYEEENEPAAPVEEAAEEAAPEVEAAEEAAPEVEAVEEAVPETEAAEAVEEAPAEEAAE